MVLSFNIFLLLQQYHKAFVSNGHVFTLAETEKGYMLQFSFNTDNEFEFALYKIENCIKKYDCSITSCNNHKKITAPPVKM